MTTPPGPLDYERHALRWSIRRLMSPNQDLETLCKHLPRLAGTAASVLRAEAAYTSSKPPDTSDALIKALSDLIEERADEEET